MSRATPDAESYLNSLVGRVVDSRGTARRVADAGAGYPQQRVDHAVRGCRAAIGFVTDARQCIAQVVHSLCPIMSDVTRAGKSACSRAASFVHNRRRLITTAASHSVYLIERCC